MQWTMAVVLAALVGAAMVSAGPLWAADEKTRSFPFSKDDIGKVPKGWKAEKTGRGEGSIWKVVEDETAIVFDDTQSFTGAVGAGVEDARAIDVFSQRIETQRFVEP